MRFYSSDASRELRRALELDPGFVAAKIQLLDHARDPQERERLLAEIRTADLEPLTDRERFLVEWVRARTAPDRERARQVLAAFVAEHPRDPWGLLTAAAEAFDREDYEAAERHYRRLLAVDPNWVVAQNLLGYMAMARGDFADAEEQFRTYAFVAPDQANPHDSLGELLAITGRIEEARAAFERALALRPDFCASYEHLIRLEIFLGTAERFEPILVRADQHCPQRDAAAYRCRARWFTAYFARDWEAPWREGFLDCSLPPEEAEKATPAPDVLAHRFALLAGREADAEAQRQRLRHVLEKVQGEGRQATWLAVVHGHFEGVDRLAAGQPAAAADSFRAADRRAVYWGLNEGQLKLFNLLNLAAALERAGDPSGSRGVVEQVAAVNRPFAERYHGVLERCPGPPGQAAGAP
jgi:tetratricopeptide (TPR) repeat protein